MGWAHLHHHLHPHLHQRIQRQVWAARLSSGFASGALSAELRFTYGANSNSARFSTTRGWFAYGTTHRSRGGFAYGAQSAELWFTYGAISTTTLVSPPAQPHPHRHLWEVSGRMPWTTVPDVLCLLHSERQPPLIIRLCNTVIL